MVWQASRHDEQPVDLSSHVVCNLGDVRVRSA